MKLGQLNEAKYTTGGKTVYFVKAFDPEDGDLETYAGPFQNEHHAKKFQKVATALVKKRLRASEDPEYHKNDMPVFIIEKIVEPEVFLQEINRHIESFLY